MEQHTHCDLDFGKAFDQVSHNVLGEAMAWRRVEPMNCSFNGQRILPNGLTRTESLLLMPQGN